MLTKLRSDFDPGEVIDRLAELRIVVSQGMEPLGSAVPSFNA
jgi:hypothetical protein